MKNLISLLGCLLFIHTSAAGKVYKVNSQNEFKKVAELVVPGDEIVIANNQYDNWELIVNTHGTAEKPILIHAETVGKVVFSGDINKPVFQLAGSFTEISGLLFLIIVTYLRRRKALGF
ncbi:chondroitinase-B domain-containing protein [Pedobacter sp. NJ-S-72]